MWVGSLFTPSKCWSQRNTRTEASGRYPALALGGFRGRRVLPLSTNPGHPRGRLPVNFEDIVFSPRAPLISLLLKDLKYAPR